MQARLFTPSQWMVILFLGLVAASSLADEPSKNASAIKGPDKSKPAAQTKPVRPEYVPIVDNPRLPRVLLIGDSISIGYTLPVRHLLAGRVNVHRPPANCGPTTTGVKNLSKWLGKGKWDVIHVNFGLHDLKMDKDKKHQVELDEYKENLKKIAKRLKKTGAKIIWCTTTPIPPEGTGNRLAKDVPDYNAAANKIMAKEGFAINDLYLFALTKQKEWQKPMDVHFTDKGSVALAGEVARSIVAALKAK